MGGGDHRLRSCWECHEGADISYLYRTLYILGWEGGHQPSVQEAAGMPGGGMRATMSGNFASTSYDVTSEAIMSMPAMPGRAGGDVTSKTQVIGKRIGDCDAPKATG